VVLAWNVFQHFYPYFDVVKTDWPGELRRALTKAATDPDEHAFLNTLRRLVAGLHDGHGNVALGSAAARLFYPPLLWDWIEGRLVVTRVAPEGPGSLKPGCVVMKVDGRLAAEALAEQEQLISGATPQWRQYRALVQLAEGAKDSEVTLDILPPSGEAQVVRLRRTLDIRTFFQEFKEPRPAKGSRSPARRRSRRSSPMSCTWTSTASRRRSTKKRCPSWRKPRGSSLTCAATRGYPRLPSAI
jgi:hypothetical protein